MDSNQKSFPSSKQFQCHNLKLRVLVKDFPSNAIIFLGKLSLRTNLCLAGADFNVMNFTYDFQDLSHFKDWPKIEGFFQVLQLNEVQYIFLSDVQGAIDSYHSKPKVLVPFFFKNFYDHKKILDFAIYEIKDH